MAITSSTTPVEPTTQGAQQGDANSTEAKKPEIDLSLNLPPVVKEAPVANDDRLKQEDALTQKVDTPKVELVETKADIVEDNLPLKAKEMTLQDDMKIIQSLGNTPAVVNGTEILPTHLEMPVVETPMPTPATSTMNLDSLLEAPGEATPAVKNPFDLVTPPATTAPAAILQTPVAPVIANAIVDKNKKVKMLFFVVLFVALGFIGYFVITTMYPMGLFNAGTSTDQVAMVLTGEELTGTELSGDVLSGTEIVMTESGSTTDVHASATTTTGADNMFEDISTIGEGDGDQTSLRISQLTTYVEQGQHYLDVGNASSNKTLIKYGLYITRKGTDLINRLETNDILVNDMVPNYLAQFSGYLVQLQTIENNALSTPSTEEIPNAPTE